VSTAQASPLLMCSTARPGPSRPCGDSSPARSSITSVISHPNASASSAHSAAVARRPGAVRHPGRRAVGGGPPPLDGAAVRGGGRAGRGGVGAVPHAVPAQVSVRYIRSTSWVTKPSRS
jgi:hypothetical protein